MYNNAAVVLLVTTVLVSVLSVRGYLLSDTGSCHHYLPSSPMVSSASGQPTNVTLEFKTPNIVQKIVVDLHNCLGHTHFQSNILLEYVDGSDITHTHRKRLVAFEMDQQLGNLYYEFDQPLFADSICLSIDADPQCAHVNAYVYGCSSTDFSMFSQCNNGGTNVGHHMCACAKGFMGKTCDDSASDLVGDDFTFVGRNNYGWIVTNNGIFEPHGDVTLEHHVMQGHAHYENALHMQTQGGHIHLNSKHDHLNTPYTHVYSGSVASVFGRHNSNGFSQTATVLFGHDHDHNHAVYLYNTHEDCNRDNPGSSLVYQDLVLHMNVHTGTQQYALSVQWFPSNSKHHVTSSFSPQYGCSIYVDGALLDSVSDSFPAHQQNCNPTNLCMGSCSYNLYDNNYHHNFPHANYWIGPVHCAGMSLPQLVLNNMLPAIGLDPNAITRPAMTPTTVQATPPPPTPRPPTTTSTTTTQQPTTITPQPTTTTTQQPSTTTQQPTTKLPTTPDIFSATGGVHTTASSQEGPLCYACIKTSSDGTCSSLKSCQAGDVCAAYHDATGYTHKCLDKAICSAAKSLTHSSCWKCCDYSLCNKQCAPDVMCEDTPNCALLMSTGYNVCSDQAAASVECKKTCGLC